MSEITNYGLTYISYYRILVVRQSISKYCLYICVDYQPEASFYDFVTGYDCDQLHNNIGNFCLRLRMSAGMSKITNDGLNQSSFIVRYAVF